MSIAHATPAAAVLPRRHCLLLAAVLLGLVAWIALRGRGWVRHELGDVLVVPLVMFAALAVAPAAWRRAPGLWALGAVAFAWLVEAGQWLGLADWLGLPPRSLWAVALGRTFSGLDLLMYAVGGLLTWGVNKSSQMLLKW